MKFLLDANAWIGHLRQTSPTVTRRLSQHPSSDVVLCSVVLGFADVVAQITDKLQAGEKVDVEQYVANHPDWAERLRELLPALQVMAELGQSAGGASGESPTKEKADTADELQGTLGDFRIIREIGSASTTKRGPPPACTTPTSSRSTPSAASAASTSTPCSSLTAKRWPR